MAQRVRHAVAISAPAEKVFAFLDVPENTLALIPQLVEVKEVTPLSNGGYRLRFVTLGRRGKLCEWVSEHVERVPNERCNTRPSDAAGSTAAGG
jgi:ligand-binding SRPBCC domain-containing protein